jgi:hypothetical protein
MIVRTETAPLEDSLLVLNPSGERAHLLDPGARAVWEAFAAGLTQEEIAAALAPVRGGLAAAKQELSQLIDCWRQEGLTADAAPVLAAEDEPAPEPLAGLAPFHADDRFRLHDLVFQIRSDSAAIRQAVLALYQHLPAKPEDGAAETVFDLFHDGSGFLLGQDGLLLARKESQDEVVLDLSVAVADLWHQRRDWLLVAHAAAVAKNGACVLMPALGGSGKSTLTAALLKKGFSLLADDIVPVLPGAGAAVPLPLCLHVKQGSVEVLRPFYPDIEALYSYPWGSTRLRFLPPPEFHQEPPGSVWPVRCIVFPKYDQEAGAAQLSPVPAAEAFRRLMEAKCLIGRPPLRVDTLRELAAWIQARPAFTLSYSSLDDAAAAVAGLYDERQAVPVSC